MKRIACHVVLLTLVLPLAACNERPRQGDGSKKAPATNGEAPPGMSQNDQSFFAEGHFALEDCLGRFLTLVGEL